MLKMRFAVAFLAAFLFGAAAEAQTTVQIANAGSTGTTLNALAKLTGAPSTAVIAGTSDTGGVLGVVLSGAGTTGNALIVRSGIASCVFDGATTAGHYVQISATVAGNCHDAGASFPTAGQIVGVVLSTNGSGGTYSTVIQGSEVQGVIGGSGCTVSGSAGIVSNNGSNACITDTNATLSAGALSLGASGTAGSVAMGNATSGTAKIQPATGALGTTIAQIPATGATNTMAMIDLADQTLTGGANVTALSQSAGNITVDCGARPGQYIANTGAFTITAPASDGFCYLDVENGASAGAITLSGFAPNTMGGATVDTTNGHNFRLFVSRNHSHANISAVALQ